MVKRVLMLSEVRVGMRDLEGFDKKVHRVPERVSAFAQGVVAELTKAALVEEVNGVARRSREAFGYMRKDVRAAVEGGAGGAGSVITPGFEYAVTVGLDEENPGEVVWRRELKNVEAEFGGALDTVFAGVFDRVEMAFDQKQSVEDVIDRIEAMRSETIGVEYEDIDLSKCEIRVKGFEGRILVTGEGLTILNRGVGSPSELMKTFLLAQRVVVEEAGGRRLEGGS